MRANQPIKIARPNLSIFQSFNQESLNQRITQSTNQPIKKASARGGQNSRQCFQVSPVAGRRSEQPKNSNHKGRGFNHLRLRHRQVSGRALASEPGRLSQLRETWAAREFRHKYCARVNVGLAPFALL
jgi:hypothetical protein